MHAQDIPFNNCRPSTLAAFIVDIETANSPHVCALFHAARFALVANCGEEEAARLIDAEKEGK